MQSLYQMELLLRIATITFLSIATIFSLYLISFSGKVRAWLLFATAFILLVCERLLDLMYHAGSYFLAEYQEIISDALLITIAACLLGGVYFISIIFFEQHAVRQELEEKQREVEKLRLIMSINEARMNEGRRRFRREGPQAEIREAES